MLKIVEWLIPESTKEKMTYAEWLMLTLAIYFHDLGMVVTKDEFEHRYDTSFKEYKEKVLENTKESEYEEYAKKTPAYMNQELWLFAIFYLVIIVTNICLTTTIYI